MPAQLHCPCRCSQGGCASPSNFFVRAGEPDFTRSRLRGGEAVDLNPNLVRLPGSGKAWKSQGQRTSPSPSPRLWDSLFRGLARGPGRLLPASSLLTAMEAAEAVPRAATCKLPPRPPWALPLSPVTSDKHSGIQHRDTERHLPSAETECLIGAFASSIHPRLLFCMQARSRSDPRDFGSFRLLRLGNGLCLGDLFDCLGVLVLSPFSCAKTHTPHSTAGTAPPQLGRRPETAAGWGAGGAPASRFRRFRDRQERPGGGPVEGLNTASAAAGGLVDTVVNSSWAWIGQLATVDVRPPGQRCVSGVTLLLVVRICILQHASIVWSETMLKCQLPPFRGQEPKAL